MIVAGYSYGLQNVPHTSFEENDDRWARDSGENLWAAIDSTGASARWAAGVHR